MKSGFQAQVHKTVSLLLTVTSTSLPTFGEMNKSMWNFNNCHRNSKLSSGGFCNNNTSKGEFCDLLFLLPIHSTGQDKLHPLVSVIGQPSGIKRGAFSYFSLLSKWLWWESFSTWYPCKMIQMVQMGTSSGKILLVTQSPAQPWTPVWSWLHPSITYKWGLIPQQGLVCP